MSTSLPDPGDLGGFLRRGGIPSGSRPIGMGSIIVRAQAFMAATEGTKVAECVDSRRMSVTPLEAQCVVADLRDIAKFEVTPGFEARFEFASRDETNRP